MELSQDDDFKKSYTKYKYIVKHWEKKFLKGNGRVPSKYDIKEADSRVREAYSRYYNLKSQMLEGALEGLLPGSPPAPTPAPTSPSFLSQLSPEPEPLCHLPSVSEIQQLVSTNISQEKEDDISEEQNIPNKVWGKHLNKKISNKKVAEKKPTSNTPEMTQKLFKSWSFNKRNPRKLVSMKTQRTADSTLDVSQPAEDKITPDPDIDLSLNFKNDSLSESGIFDQYFTENKIVNTPKEQFTPLNPIKSMTTSSMPRVRNIDSNWLERCNEILPSNDVNNEEHLKSDFNQSSQAIDQKVSNNYGLRNLNINLSPSIASEFLSTDCIENSESENDESIKNNTYVKIKPVIKRQKIEAKPDEKIENNSAESITPEKPKRKTRMKEKPVKNKRVKKSNKSEVPSTEQNEMPDNDFYELEGDKVDMPRFIINSSVFKETTSNLVDGLTKAIALPKNFKKSKNDETLSSKEDSLQRKLNDGSINDNFVRINIEKKVFVRGKKTINYSKFKKQQWKNKKKALNELGPEFPEGGVLKCFKCGETGHFSRYCRAHKGNDLLPLEDSAEKSSHLSLQEMESSSQKENITQNENLLFETINSIPNVDEVLDSLSVNKVIPKSEPLPESFLKLLAAPINKSNGQKSIEPIYSLTSEHNLIDTPMEIYEALKQFGHENFRSGQEQAIMRILSGLSTLVTLSTGSGKSLCYQLPAFIYAKYNKCITLVISPLVSLMEDQVVNMPDFLHAGCLHTNQTPVQRQKIVDLIKEGKIDILLISPEAIVSGERSSGFGGLLKQLPPVAFACIDEVHCVSQWSHNFRPSYLMICRVLKEKLGVKCILGLTATATTSSTNSIVEHIGISDGLNGVITNMPLPNNLILTVSTDNRRDHALLELLKSERFEKCNSVIVYCIRRDECQRIAGLIRTTLQDSNEVLLHNVVEKSTRKRKRYNWFAESYHAGMSAAKRRKVQEAFMSGELKIVVATVAFGMGINKSDIRGVIHFNMPSSFESYVQEVGRAGRDGLPAQCHVFIDRDCKDKHELLRHIHSNSIERHVIRKLLQKIFIPCACKAMKMKSGNEDTTDSNMLKCQGHEVAFPIDETVQELDIPAENICTLLCYLELHANKYIKILSNAYISCKVISYGGFPALLQAAQKCPPLAMAIALEKKKGNTFQNVGTFEFPVIDIAAAVGWESGLVKYHLKNLEWETENGRPKRSLLRVEYNTLGFRVMAPGDLDSTQLDVALDSLYERTQLQEKTMLCQLQEVSKMLKEVSYPSIHDCNIFEKETVYKENSDILKQYIHKYFLRDSITDDFEHTEYKAVNEAHVISDVRGLIATYKDCTFTGRAIARIFQGIASPNFPAIVWGRCRYWRSHLFDDFYKLSEIAKQQIMQMR